MCKLTFSHGTNGINHDKVCSLPTCLHLLYPDTPQPLKAALGNWSRVCLSLCCSRKHQLQKMLEALVVDNKKRNVWGGGFTKWFRPEQRKVWGRREWCEHPLWVPGARCLPSISPRQMPFVFKWPLVCEKSISPIFLIQKHFYQRMTRPIMQKNDARWQGPHSHQVDRLTNDLDIVFTVHAFNR